MPRCLLLAMAVFSPTDTSSTSDPRDLNFGLTEREFTELQEKIRQGDEQLFEQVFLTRFEHCVNFLKGKYKAEHGNAYDTVMRSLLIFRQRLILGNLKYDNLQAFLLRIVDTRYLKDYAKDKVVSGHQGGSAAR